MKREGGIEAHAGTIKSVIWDADRAVGVSAGDDKVIRYETSDFGAVSNPGRDPDYFSHLPCMFSPIPGGGIFETSQKPTP